MKILVSACLMGRKCRYDGRSKGHDGVRAATEGHEVVAVCPEEHLGVPRPPAHLVGGDGHDVLDGNARVERVHDGHDLTQAFVDGAHRAFRPCDHAILKARSPSCGTGTDGVFAALLRRNGISLQSEEDL